MGTSLDKIKLRIILRGVWAAHIINFKRGVVFMLRSKGLTEKVILLGIDGMDPKFSRRMVDEGKMPNLKKMIEMGAARHDLRLLGAVPTITPPMWTTLCTGAYPMTHGIEDFNINLKGELDVNFAGIYSKYCHAEQLWNVTAEAGKKTLVWHWPGSAWPPSSDSPNLMVADGTTPGALGFGFANRDGEYVLIASEITPEAKYYSYVNTNSSKLTGDPSEIKQTRPPYTKMPDQPHFNEVWEQFKEGIDGFNDHKLIKYLDMRTMVLMPGDSQMETLHCGALDIVLSPIGVAEGWANAPEDAKEFTMLQLRGKMQKPCLILKNEAGVYDRVAIYADKTATEPLAVLENDVYTPNVYDVVPRRDGSLEKVIRNMRVLNLAEDGSFIRIWISNAFTAEDDSTFYPKSMFHTIVEKFGPPVPTGMKGDGDLDIINKCNREQWRQAAKWQADSIKYMIQEEGVEVVFSHFHGPDLAGHTYMKSLKEREDSNATEEEMLMCHVGTHTMTDEYIGEFLPLVDEGWTILLFSDHSLICPKEDFMIDIADNYGINMGLMSRLGYTVMKKDENGNNTPEIDWEKTVAVQQRSNSIFINLKGRDRFGIVDPADKYELEEKIITDLYGVKDPNTGHRVIALALHQKDANLLGLGGEHTAGDIIFFVHESYVHDHGESLSTAEGYADTSVGPIFVACGPGIKQGYEMELFPREVDVTPTAAVLLGVRIPAQCEGAPVYSILTEEL